MSLVIFPRQFSINAAGAIAGSSIVNVFDAGTTTPRTAYTTAALSTPHPTDIPASNVGLFPAIYVNPALGDYKLVFKNSLGSTVWTEDNIPALPSATAYYHRTAGEIAASKTPSSYLYIPGDRAPGDIRRYGVTDASSASAIANAVQDALASHNYAYIPQGDWAWNPVLMTAVRQRIYGAGFRTQLIIAGSGIGIDFDGYAGCEVADLVMYSTTADRGIRVGPNSGATRFAHWWRLKRVMAIGNTPNWSTTSLASSRSGFATAAIQINKSFYGLAEHCETSYAVGNGFHLLQQANGNTLTGCHARDNAVGLKIEGTGTGNSNGNCWLGGNIEASINNSIGIDIGEADRNVFTGRMEVSAASGGKHVRINPPSSTLAQQNKFLGMMCTGTSAGYELGDGSGSNQVRGTQVVGGPVGSSITINSDAIGTVFDLAPSDVSGVTITDNGYGTIMRGDFGGGKWYERPSAANTTANDHGLLVGVGSVDESLGDNLKSIGFTSFSNAFQWKKVDGGGTNLAVMLFNGYRVWVSPTNGKMYIKSSDPTAHDDGTVLGTQS